MRSSEIIWLFFVLCADRCIAGSPGIDAPSEVSEVNAVGAGLVLFVGERAWVWAGDGSGGWVSTWRTNSSISHEDARSISHDDDDP